MAQPTVVGKFGKTTYYQYKQKFPFGYKYQKHQLAFECLLWARHNVGPFIYELNSNNNPVREYLYHIHFTDEEAESK